MYRLQVLRFVLPFLLAPAALWAQDLPVYDDTLQSGFEDYSYGGGADFGASAPIHGGSKSISFTGNNYNAVSFAHTDAGLLGGPVSDSPLLGPRRCHGRAAASGLSPAERRCSRECRARHLRLRWSRRRGHLERGRRRPRPGAAVLLGLLRPHRPAERHGCRPADSLLRRRQARRGRIAAPRERPPDRARRDGLFHGERPLHLDRLGGKAAGRRPRAQRRGRGARWSSRRRAAPVPVPDARRFHARRRRHELRQRRLRRVRVRRLPRLQQQLHRRRLAPRRVLRRHLAARLRRPAPRRLPVHAELPAKLLDDAPGRGANGSGHHRLGLLDRPRQPALGRDVGPLRCSGEHVLGRFARPVRRAEHRRNGRRGHLGRRLGRPIQVHEHDGSRHARQLLDLERREHGPLREALDRVDERHDGPRPDAAQRSAGRGRRTQSLLPRRHSVLGDDLGERERRRRERHALAGQLALPGQRVLDRAEPQLEQQRPAHLGDAVRVPRTAGLPAPRRLGELRPRLAEEELLGLRRPRAPQRGTRRDPGRTGGDGPVPLPLRDDRERRHERPRRRRPGRRRDLRPGGPQPRLRRSRLQRQGERQPPRCERRESGRGR